MSNNLILEVIYRLEPGCLGPQGADYIKDFCVFAQPLVDAQSPSFLRWQLVPRYDKQLPEMQCMLSGKQLNEQQSTRWLAVYNTDPDQLVEELNHQLTFMIDQFFGRW